MPEHWRRQRLDRAGPRAAPLRRPCSAMLPSLTQRKPVGGVLVQQALDLGGGVQGPGGAQAAKALAAAKHCGANRLRWVGAGWL